MLIKERREKLAKLIEQPESNWWRKNLKLSILTVISGAKTVDILEIIKNIILNKSKLQDIEKWLNFRFFIFWNKEKNLMLKLLVLNNF